MGAPAQTVLFDFLRFVPPRRLERYLCSTTDRKRRLITAALADIEALPATTETLAAEAEIYSELLELDSGGA